MVNVVDDLVDSHVCHAVPLRQLAHRGSMSTVRAGLLVGRTYVSDLSIRELGRPTHCRSGHDPPEC